MNELRGWGLPESHLLPDAVVAFVDQELSLAAHERAACHVARCPACAADVSAQRQARTAVQSAHAPSMSAGFLASLRSIPQDADIPAAPDNLAVTEDGQLVAVQRPDRVAGLQGAAPTSVLGDGAVLGQSPTLGNSANVLGAGSRLNTGATRRRAAQGAGVVVSGLVLSALALVATPGATSTDVPPDPSGQLPPPGVLRAQFGGAPTTTTTVPTTTPPTTPVTPTTRVAPAAADELLVGRR